MATFNQKMDLFVDRMQQIWSTDRETVIKRLSIQPKQSIRINPLVQDPQSTLKEMQYKGWHITQIPWCEESYFYHGDKKEVSQSDLFQNGAIYMQNASSFVAVVLLDPKPSETILDMAASPGGKASHIAARTQNKAHVYVNDSDFHRTKILTRILTNLKVTPAQITTIPGQLLPEKISVRFDKVLLDAPCSAESYIRPTNIQSVAHWNLKRVKMFSKLQKKLIASAYQLLKPGGTLVYSTCTYSPEENEEVVDSLLSEHVDMKVVPVSLHLPSAVLQTNKTLRILPEDFFEGFYVAVLRKALCRDGEINNNR